MQQVFHNVLMWSLEPSWLLSVFNACLQCPEVVLAGEKILKKSFSGLQPQWVYKIIVIVNACLLLWKTRLTFKKSVVYLKDNPVQFCAGLLVMNLDKIFACAKRTSSSQSTPVDIK